MANHYSFYCGYFSAESAGVVLPEMWSEVVASSREVEEYRRFYYPEFVDFSLGVSADSCKRMRYVPERKDISLLLRGVSIPVRVENVTLYLMPEGVVVFSVAVSATSDDLNDFTAVSSYLRYVASYDLPADDVNDISEFLTTAIDPVKGVYELLKGSAPSDSTALIENGNKLKIFQVIDAPLQGMSHEARDILLFELGALSKVGFYDKNDIHCISEDYMKKILQEGRLSIYNNWLALGLLDTFTILACDFKEFHLDNWINDYFSMIYIHNLFVKVYLFNLNNRFRARCEDNSVLAAEFDDFSRKFVFSKISYNFLPLEIDKLQDRALEINEEKEQLHASIQFENERKEKSNDKRINNLLFFLTCITMISAIWDTSCLLDQLLSFRVIAGSEMFGYRISTSVITMAIIVAAFFILRRKKE